MWYEKWNFLSYWIDIGRCFMLLNLTTLSEIDRKTSLWLYFDSQMSDFKQFERGTKTQDHRGTKNPR